MATVCNDGECIVNDTRLKRFNISFEMLKVLLQLPDAAEIERVHMSNDYTRAVTFVIRCENFPELQWGDMVPYISNVIFRRDNETVISWDITGIEGM